MEKPNRPRGRTRARDAVDIASFDELGIVLVRLDRVGALVEHFEGRRLQTARSIYYAVAELFWETAPSELTEATRKDVAARAGVSVRTLEEYVPELAERGFLVVQHRKDGDMNLPNLWGLGNRMGGVSEAAADTEAAAVQRPSSSVDPPEEEERLGRGGVRGGEPLARSTNPDVAQLVAAKRRVDGRVVLAEEMLIAAEALDEFNRQAETEYGLGPNLTSLIMRIRERPSMDASKHVRLVQSAFRLKWWEQKGKGGRRVTPNVIYGNSRVFEQVIQDAVDERKGVETVDDRRRRFDRKVVRDDG